MMETTKVNAAAKGNSSKAAALLGIAGWASLALGVLVLAFGLFKQVQLANAPRVATYRDSSVYVTATYGKDARIPAEAELRASLVTPEADPDAYAQKMEAAMAAAGRSGEAAPANVIYNVGFYVGEQAVEPAAPVDVTVQPLQGGFAVGTPVTVIHFGAEAAEVLADTVVAEGGHVAFTTGGFSDYAFISGDVMLTALDGDGTNLNDMEGGYIASAELTDKNGNKLGSGDTVVLGEKYTYKVKFQEHGNKQFTAPMTFTLPKGFLANDVENEPIKDENNQEIGHYSIKNGVVTYYLEQEYLDAHADVWIETSFNMTATGAGEGGTLYFPWTGGEVLHFGTSGKPEVQLTKKVGSFDPAQHTIDYTVTLEVSNGVVRNTQITDTMEKGVSVLTDETGNPIDYTITVTDKDGKDVTPSPAPTLVKTDNGWETQGLPSPLPAGYKVTVEYKAVVEYNDNGSVAVDTSKGETPFRYTVDNTADVTCEAVPGEEQEVAGTKSAKQQLLIEDKQLEKDGTAAAGNTVDWEIMVGTGYFDVRGQTLTDEIGDGQWIDTSKPLEIKWKNGDNTMKTMTINWLTEDGTPDEEKLAEQGITDIKKDAAGRIIGFKVTIPDAGHEFWNDIPDKKRPDGHVQGWQRGDWVKIEYYTKYDKPADGSSIPYTNKVAGLTDKVPEGVDGNIVIGEGGIQKELTKDVPNGTFPDGDYVEYKLTVKVPAKEELLRATNPNGDEAGPSYEGTEYPYFYIQDQLEFPADKIALYDESGNRVPYRYFVDNTPTITDVTAMSDSGKTYTFEELPLESAPFNGADANTRYTYTIVHTTQAAHKDTREFEIWFNINWNADDQEGHNNSLWPFDENVTLTFTYRVPGNSLIVKEVSKDVYEPTGYTLRDLIDTGSRLDNEVWGKYRHVVSTTFTSEATYTKTPEAQDITKFADLLDGNEITYSVRYDNAYRYTGEDGQSLEQEIVHAFTKEEIATFQFQDVFDSRLEYVEGSMQVLVFDVDRSLRGYYNVSDDSNITISEGATRTTLTVPASAFDNLHNNGSSDSGLYGKTSLKEWLLNYQMSKADPDRLHSPKDSRYVFQYKLRIKPEAMTGDELTLDNTAHVIYGAVDLTDTAQVSTQPSIMEKSSAQHTNGAGEKTNIIDYTIEVNPGAVDLATGTAADGSTLPLDRYTVTDTMAEDMVPMWDTVKVEYWDAASQTYKELARTIDETEVDTTSYKYYARSEGTNDMVFVVPDDLKIRITYQVKLDAKIGDKFSAYNKVSLEGKGSISDVDDTVFDVQTEESRTGATDSVWLLKQDAATKQVIDGSAFQLYTKSGSESGSVKVDGTTLTAAGTYAPTTALVGSTGRQGIAIEQPADAEPDDYYVLVETTAPNGYILDPTPIVFKFGKQPDGEPEKVTVTVGSQTYEVEVKYLSSGYTIEADNTPAQYELPETGGNGTCLIIAAGFMLVCSALALTTKKRLHRAK